MPGPYTSFTRATSDIPGPAPSQYYYYWPHSSGLCNMMIWRPSAVYQNAPVIVIVHGGLGYNPGIRAMTSNTIVTNSKINQVCSALSAKGWVVVSIDHPVCSSNAFEVAGGVSSNEIFGSWAEIHPLSMWPEQPGYLALAIAHIRANWSAVSGSTNTVFGAAMWGTGNSVSPEFIHVYGNSWGGTMALYAGLQPTGYYPFEQSLGHEIMDPYWPRASHRCRSISFTSPQIDLTQFYIDTGVTSPLGPPYMGDRAQWLMRTESGRTWSTTAMWQKKQSPWWVLQENHAENENLSCFGEFLGTGVDNQFNTSAWDEELSYLDWNPGVTANDTANLKAWVDPHDGRLQGKPFADACANYGSGSSAMRKSVIRWAGSGSTNPIFSQVNYVSRFLAWLADLGYPNV